MRNILIPGYMLSPGWAGRYPASSSFGRCNSLRLRAKRRRPSTRAQAEGLLQARRQPERLRLRLRPVITALGNLAALKQVLLAVLPALKQEEIWRQQQLRYRPVSVCPNGSNGMAKMLAKP